jgi:large subunit ribosomal protein L29
MRWLDPRQKDEGRRQNQMKAKLKELRDRSVEDLQREVVEKQKHLFDLRSQAVTEKLEDPSQLKKTRKQIARIKTILRERQQQQQTAAVAK